MNTPATPTAAPPALTRTRRGRREADGKGKRAADLYGKAADAHADAVAEYRQALGIDTFEKRLKERRRQAVARIAAAEAAAAAGDRKRAAREYREAAKAHLDNANTLGNAQQHERTSKELELTGDCYRYAAGEHSAAGDKAKAIADYEAAAVYYVQAASETDDPVRKKALNREAAKAQARADALK
jgi:hypothetical protein